MKLELRGIIPLDAHRVWAEIYAYGEKIGDIIAMMEELEDEDAIEVNYFIKLTGKDWKIVSDRLMEKICKDYGIPEELFKRLLDRLTNIFSPDDVLMDDDFEIRIEVEEGDKKCTR